MKARKRRKRAFGIEIKKLEWSGELHSSFFGVEMLLSQ